MLLLTTEEATESLNEARKQQQQENRKKILSYASSICLSHLNKQESIRLKLCKKDKVQPFSLQHC